jgi:serine phosphatase RsbU (regulator of sigma subunit)
MERLKLAPDYWLTTPQLQAACASTDIQRDKKPAYFLTGPRLPFTYLHFYLPSPQGDRVVVISMDGVGGDLEGSTLALTDPTGKILWSNTSADAFSADLAHMAPAATEKNMPSITPSSSVGHIIASAPMFSGYVLFSISKESVALAPVYFVLKQAVLFALGCVFLALLIGKIAAGRLSNPLLELRKMSEKFGNGDLQSRVVPTGNDELTQVQNTFNNMADHIVKLVEETKHKAAMDSEMSIAKKVQQWFFPENKIVVQGHEFNSSVNMAQSCGGDFWGYIEIPRPIGSPLLIVMIADAVGHGISSALLTAAANGGLAMMSSWAKENPTLASDPKMILKFFNHVIYRATQGEMHMTFFVAIMDSDAETVTVANAGHVKPYLITQTADGPGIEIKPLGEAGPVLGPKLDAEFLATQTHPWRLGDQIIFYTDGLIDCQHGDKVLFERRTLVKILKKHGHLKREALLKSLLGYRLRLIGNIPQEDDVTVVLCTRLNKSSEGTQWVQT